MAINTRGSEHTSKTVTRPAVDLTPAVLILRQALGPRAVVDWLHGPDGRPGAVVAVQWSGAATGPHRLRLVPFTTGPARGRTGREGRDGPVVPVVWVLSRAPARLREALRARGEHYVDVSGAVHLALPWALVDRTDLAPVRPTTPVRASADPFADKSSIVLRGMLEQRELRRVWGVRELAGVAGVSVATASEVLRALAERQLVSVVRRGRASEVRLGDPFRVLEAWTRAYDWRLNRGMAVEVPMGDAPRFLRRLPRWMSRALPKEMRWALTLQAGASLVAPHATWERVHVYVDVPPPGSARKLAAIAARADWAPAPEGRLVLLLPHYTVSAWHGLRVMEGLPVVSDLQLVLDLWHYPLRGREQAEHLLERLFRVERTMTRASSSPRD